jgi:hypothetical protein
MKVKVVPGIFSVQYAIAEVYDKIGAGNINDKTNHQWRKLLPGRANALKFIDPI